MNIESENLESGNRELLRWFACLLLLLPVLSFAQPSNDSIFAQLKQQARTELTDSVWQKATFGHEVTYIKAGEAWARTVSLTATWGQAALDLSRTDTLSRTQVRAVRRASSPPFRGDAPGIWQKTLLPALGLVAGTACVVVLFYLRSR
jgi:hypothetical protein